ncbi:hypothetical protein R1flu_002966 [Riccia fluitans]|uniref:Uncharacterized protein n=1 Tax=Riccia fluitans TaxID=41844 RepID=A0ABD1Y7M5_9MARC
MKDESKARVKGEYSAVAAERVVREGSTPSPADDHVVINLAEPADETQRSSESSPDGAWPTSEIEEVAAALVNYLERTSDGAERKRDPVNGPDSVNTPLKHRLSEQPTRETSTSARGLILVC